MNLTPTVEMLPQEYNLENAVQTLGELILLDFFLMIEPDESFEHLLPIHQQVSEDFDIDIVETITLGKNRAREIFVAMKDRETDANANAKQMIKDYVDYIVAKYYDTTSIN